MPSAAARAGVAMRRMRSPKSSISPESGRVIPLTILTSVDLPAPFSPISACADPAAMSNATPFRAMVAP